MNPAMPLVGAREGATHLRHVWWLGGDEPAQEAGRCVAGSVEELIDIDVNDPFDLVPVVLGGQKR